MAMNLTNQVRSIAAVTKAVAGGDLSKRVEIDVKGEFLELKETVNQMTSSLSVFADEVRLFINHRFVIYERCIFIRLPE